MCLIWKEFTSKHFELVLIYSWSFYVSVQNNFISTFENEKLFLKGETKYLKQTRCWSWKEPLLEDSAATRIYFSLKFVLNFPLNIKLLSGGQNVEWHFVESVITSSEVETSFDEVKLPMALEKITPSKVSLSVNWT